MLLLGSRSGDRYGRRRMLTAGLWVFATGLIVAGTASSFWQLCGGRIVQGAGAALAVPNSFSMISDTPSASGRNRHFAAVAVAGGIGAAAGAVAGGLITQGLGWRWIFGLMAPAAMAAAALVPRLPHGPAAREAQLDVGAVMLSLPGLAVLLFAITNIEREGIGAPATLGALLLAAALLAAFVLRERKAVSPLLPRGLLRGPALRAAVLGVTSEVMAYDGTVFLGLLFFQHGLGYSPLVAGLAFSPLGLGVLAGSRLVAPLLRRSPWPAVVAGSQSAAAGALVWLSDASRGSGYLSHILPPLAILGTASALSVVSFNIAAGKDIGPADKGAAYPLLARRPPATAGRVTNGEAGAS